MFYCMINLLPSFFSHLLLLPIFSFSVHISPPFLFLSLFLPTSCFYTLFPFPSRSWQCVTSFFPSPCYFNYMILLPLYSIILFATCYGNCYEFLSLLPSLFLSATYCDNYRFPFSFHFPLCQLLWYRNCYESLSFVFLSPLVIVPTVVTSVIPFPFPSLFLSTTYCGNVCNSLFPSLFLPCTCCGNCCDESVQLLPLLLQLLHKGLYRPLGERLTLPSLPEHRQIDR